LQMRGDNLQIRLTEAQRRAFSDMAKEAGLPVATWARMILLRQIRIDQKNEMENEK